MQLKRGATPIRSSLMAASCMLLGISAAGAQDVPTPVSDSDADSGQIDWLLDSALAYYHENGRIQAIEPIIDVSHDDGAGNVMDFNATYDSLSGASPNGALPSNKPQTFATPSGTNLTGAPHTYATSSGQLVSKSSPLYSTRPGELPVDPNYHDQRIALGASWQVPLSRLVRWSLGGKLSWEHDFLSLTADTSVSRDFNEKNTTLSFGISDESDRIKPIGGSPVPGSDYALFDKAGHTSKNGVAALAGLTQVMSRNWLTQLNLSVDQFSGYLNDPYKIISELDASGNTVGYLYERRPSQRTRASVYLENRVGGARTSAALSLRYMSDSWHIRSETAELKLRWWTDSHGQYLEPSARWYHQTGADFYVPWLESGMAATYASADQRLAPFHALTYGVKYGHNLEQAFDEPGAEFSVRLEYYRQLLDQVLPAPAALQGLNLYPNLQSILLEFGLSY